MPRFTRRRLLSLLLPGVIVTLGMLLLDTESHHTSLKYLVWKHFAVGDWKRGVRFLNVDSEFRHSFYGRPRAHLMRWFPDLRPGTSRRHVCPDAPQWHDVNEQQDRGEWIGGSPFLVIYDPPGIVKDIYVPKGC